MIRKAGAIVARVVMVLAVCLVPASPALADEPEGGFDRGDFVRIAEGGFDNPMNNYAWSMTEFNGALYVGTARNFLGNILEILEASGLMPPGFDLGETHASGDPWSYERAQDMCGEIWRYHEGNWERVYQSVAVNVSS